MASDTRDGLFSSGQAQMVVSLVGCAAIGYTFVRSGDGDDDRSFIVGLIHLTALSMWFGAQIWHTFFAALTMFQNIGIRTFGHLQGKLFPKYFTLGTTLWSVIIVSHLWNNPYKSWEAHDLLHAAVLGAGFLATLANVLLLSPLNISIMDDLFEIEKEAGLPDEMKSKIDYSKVKENPQWAELHKQFGLAHGLGSIGNLVSILATMFHLYKVAENMD